MALDLEKAKKELKQLRILILVIAVLQVGGLVFTLMQPLASVPLYYSIIVGLSTALAIVTAVGLFQEKNFGLYLGYLTGAMILINNTVQINIIGIIIGVIWLWSFFRIRPVFAN